MPRLEPGSGQRMLAKTCLACGYRGSSLQGPDRAIRCPSCGEDHYSRPPRSYAELEGFIPIEEPDDLASQRNRQSTHQLRWKNARDLIKSAFVMAMIITPPLIVVAAAGALAAIWMLRG